MRETARNPCGIKLGANFLGLHCAVDKQLAPPPAGRNSPRARCTPRHPTPDTRPLPPLSRCSCTFSVYATQSHAPQPGYNSPQLVENSPHDARRSQWMHARKAFPQTSCVGIRSHWKFPCTAHALAVGHRPPSPIPPQTHSTARLLFRCQPPRGGSSSSSSS